MLKIKGKESLADKISGILSTAPSSFDPEDDTIDETRAKLDEDNDDDFDDEKLLGQFRKENVDLLADIDEKYKGKKTSRKDLRDSDEDISDEAETSENDDLSDDTSLSDKIEETPAENEDDEDTEGTNSENNSDKSAVESDSNDETIIARNDDSNFKHMSDTNVSSQMKKGLCVRNQLSIWEDLLEVRIQLQKSLVAANKMPQKETFIEIKKESGKEFMSKLAETKRSLLAALKKLVTLQTLLQKKYPETTNLHEIKLLSKHSHEDDEEIPSDTDEENVNNETEPEVEEIVQSTPKKLRKLNDYESDINTQYNLYKDYRNSVIQKWNEKTKITIAKNNATSHSVLNQIDHILSDKPRLIKRTQLRRSNYNILGECNTNEKVDESGEMKSSEEYNTNIFDDDDFYHQLLRELIEVKSADLTDPVQLGRQWIQLQNLRSKMKRKIDTRATKGRKIRYAVHSKLVNFMAPIDENQWTDEAKNELYSSLFGKNQSISV